MRLETPRLLLRNFIPEDAPDVFAFASDPETTRMVGWPCHRALAETSVALEAWQRQETRLAMVLRETGRVIGFIVANGAEAERQPAEWELAFAIHPAYRRRGLTREAVEAVLAALFAMDAREVWACCYAQNAASRGLIEACGFTFVQPGVLPGAQDGETCPSREYRTTAEEYARRQR